MVLTDVDVEEAPTMTDLLDDVEAARLGQTIQRRRTALLIGSQRVLATKAGVAKPTVQRLESGSVHNPRPDVLARIEHALGYEVGTLIRAARGLASANELNVAASAPGAPPRMVVGDSTSNELTVLTRELARHTVGDQRAAIQAALDVLRHLPSEGGPDDGPSPPPSTSDRSRHE
jgi:transcriptional regulator with XRE-family HTH domain